MTTSYLTHLDRLIRRGRELRAPLTTDPADGSTLASTRIWQRDCGALIHQLSGGSKAHWLAVAFSEAFLIRSGAGRVVDEADVAEIVDRLVDVLGRAVASLSRMDEGEIATARSSEGAPPKRRFEFVHNAELRPIIEQAFADSRGAFESGDFRQALTLSCSVLEAVITDALEAGGWGLGAGGSLEAGDPRLEAGGWRLGNHGTISDWSFDARIASAERAGLIRGGCARLPPVARAYRDLTTADGDLRSDVPISEREAQLARQVLLVVLRDLDPGR